MTKEEAQFVLAVADDYSDHVNGWGYIDDSGVAHF